MCVKIQHNKRIDQKTIQYPEFIGGIGSKINNTPINKMGVTVSDLCDQFKKSQIFPIKKTDHIAL